MQPTYNQLMQGRTLEGLAAEVTRQHSAKHDLIADTPALSVAVDDNGSMQLNTGEGFYTCNDHATRQIATAVDIPTRHFEKLRTRHPDIAQDTVNKLFEREPRSRMVRTLDGNARAFLSDKYKILDNQAVLGTALAAVQQLDGEMKVASCQVTDTRLYLKVVFPKLENAVKVGDPVQAGFTLSNSEVGSGTLSVLPFIYRLICTNGMTTADKHTTFKRTHLGRRQDSGILYQQDTLDAATEATLLQMRDHIATVSRPEHFQQVLEQMQATTERRISGSVPAAVKVLGDTLRLTEQEQDNVLTSLIEGGDLSQWGMLNAVTDSSKKAGDYNRASEIESLGGKVLDLNPAQWKRVAEAA